MIVAQKKCPSAVPPLLWLLGLICLLLVPFANKGVHIDDTLFLRAAQHIQQHPGDFYGFSINWYGKTQPMTEAFENPPLACYYLAAASSVLGWSETALHLSFLLPALAAIWGIYSLARTLKAPPLLAAAAGAVTPVFFISATTLMCDVILLAFMVWAVVCFERGLQTNCRNEFMLSGMLAALACLTKFTGLSLVPLLLAYGFCRVRTGGRWLVAPLLAILFALGYEIVSAELYGKGLIFSAASVSSQTGALHTESLLSRQLTGLSYLGGCYLPLLLFVGWLWSLRNMLLWLALATPLVLACPYSGKFVLLWDPNGRPNWILCVQTALFIISGVHVLFLAVHDWWSRRDASSVLLLLWTAGIYVFATVFNWTVNGRSLLPMLPAVALLFSRQLQSRLLQFPRPHHWFRFWQFAPAAALTLLVVQSDYVLAESSRLAATDAWAMYSGPGKVVWFEGHWGFQHYMEKLGARPLEPKLSGAHEGDFIVVPSEAVNLFDFPTNAARLVDTLEYQPSKLCVTMNTCAGAGFYAATGGPFPFSFANIGSERYYVFEVIADPSANHNAHRNGTGPGALSYQFWLERETAEREYVLRVNPRNTAARMELAMLAQAQQRRGEAVRQYKLVLGEDPNSHIALNNLAWILSTDNDARFRDAKQAISLAAKADELTNHSEPRILLTLSAAFAEAGEYDKAVSKAECALKLAQDRDNLEFVRLSQTLLERFRARQSFHQFCDRNVALLRQDPAAGS